MTSAKNTLASLQVPEHSEGVDLDDYDFIEKPSKEFYCPITFDLLREPYQTGCCGNHLSQEAVTELQKSREPCPLCKAALKTHPDKFFKRKVNGLQVRCPNKAKGCNWVGELGSLNQHLNKSTSEGDCQYVTIDCRYLCGANFQRCQFDQLEDHEVSDCPNRPFTCEFCDHKATYNEVTGEHWRFCEKYPVECPNKSLGCQWSGAQGDIDTHLNYGSFEGECQFVLVVCPCDCYGEFQRRQVEGHKVNDCPNRPFTCRYCSYEATYNEVTNEHWTVCEKYPLPCPSKCEEDGIERQDLEKHFQVCPRQVIECEFNYAGCELGCERQHMQRHVAENTKTHLSLVSKVVEEQQDTIREHHQTFKVAFEDHQNVVKGQMTELETRIEEKCIEIERLNTKIEDLNRNFEEQNSRMKETAVRQYTKIEEQDAKIQEQESIITDQRCAINQQQKQIEALISALSQVALVVPKPLIPVFIPPPTFVMTCFEERKKSNDLWYSCPFYSHIGGYKMCLRVNANGTGTGRGTHVSVAVQLIQGEHDDHLNRPFCGDITWQLLNQRRDEGHVEKTVNFYDTVGDGAAGSPARQEIATQIRGYSKFISHTELLIHNQDKEYLENDSLKFRILTVVVKSDCIYVQ